MYINNNYSLKNKDFYIYKDLTRLPNDIFNILINIHDDSSNKKKYIQLAKYLVRRFTIWKPTPSFPIYLCDLPIRIKKELMQLAEPELDDLLNNIIDKIFQYSLKDEEYFNYNYFIKEVRESYLLQWRLI